MIENGVNDACQVNILELIAIFTEPVHSPDGKKWDCADTASLGGQLVMQIIKRIITR